jgi:hypothetical protein
MTKSTTPNDVTISGIDLERADAFPTPTRGVYKVTLDGRVVGSTCQSSLRDARRHAREILVKAYASPYVRGLAHDGLLAEGDVSRTFYRYLLSTPSDGGTK